MAFRLSQVMLAILAISALQELHCLRKVNHRSKDMPEPQTAVAEAGDVDEIRASGISAGPTPESMLDVAELEKEGEAGQVLPSRDVTPTEAVQVKCVPKKELTTIGAIVGLVVGIGAATFIGCVLRSKPGGEGATDEARPTVRYGPSWDAASAGMWFPDHWSAPGTPHGSAEADDVLPQRTPRRIKLARVLIVIVFGVLCAGIGGAFGFLLGFRSERKVTIQCLSGTRPPKNGLDCSLVSGQQEACLPILEALNGTRTTAPTTTTPSEAIRITTSTTTTRTTAATITTMTTATTTTTRTTTTTSKMTSTTTTRTTAATRTTMITASTTTRTTTTTPETTMTTTTTMSTTTTTMTVKAAGNSLPQDAEEEIDCEEAIQRRLEDLRDRIGAYYQHCHVNDEVHITYHDNIPIVGDAASELLCDKSCQSRQEFAEDAPDSSRLIEACDDNELVSTIRVHDAFDAARKSCPSVEDADVDDDTDMVDRLDDKELNEQMESFGAQMESLMAPLSQMRNELAAIKEATSNEAIDDIVSDIDSAGQAYKEFFDTQKSAPDVGEIEKVPTSMVQTSSARAMPETALSRVLKKQKAMKKDL